MKVIIAGGRDFNNKELLYAECDAILPLSHGFTLEIVCGMCKGTDMLGFEYARDRSLMVTKFYADWSKGRSAGPERNKKMSEYADALIAFWDGKSKGTKNMIDLARAKGLKVRIVKI